MGLIHPYIYDRGSLGTFTINGIDIKEKVRMLTGKQRSYLRSLANTIPPIFQVGKAGVSDNMVTQFEEALEARELIKATVLKNSLEDVRSICEEIAERTHSEIVQVIGNKFVLYKESEDNKVIKLP